ncbi:MAG: hypothetical protein KKF50_00340 [Nanoarchaeota archaeon]|nr:hypothetical protein [Nanoarchaeota archaeon]
MNKKGFSLFGFGVFIVGLIIATYPFLSCIGNGGAPYDIVGINKCIFSLSFLVKIMLGSIIAIIGAVILKSKS